MEKYLFQKITDMPENNAMYRNQSFQFEAETLDHILNEFVEFLQASGFPYVASVTANYADE